jgi:hypothetical protein
MKILKSLLISVVLALCLTPSSFAQTALTRTTLSSAVTAGAAINQVVVASATGITASTSSTQNYILVDRELMLVAAVNSTTLTVRRSQSGTLAVGHKSGAQVLYGSGGTFNSNSGNVSGVFLSGSNSANPTGSCTRTNQQYLPVISLMSGYENGFTYDCLGGQWVQGTLPDHPDAVPLNLVCNVSVGPVAYGSAGTDTAFVDGTTFSTSIIVPQTAYLTGIAVLSGSATGNLIASIYDSSGNVLAGSATAGTAQSGTNAYTNFPFTAAKLLVGPARYLIGIQTSGTTGKLRTVAASTFKQVLGTSQTGTFGTVPSTITVPTTFTADKAPYSCLYY